MSIRKFVLSWGIAATILSPSLLAFVPQAQSLPGEFLVSVDFPSTGGGGSTSRSAKGGTRGSSPLESCVNETGKPLTVLMPQNNVGTMVTENPEVYWYIPETRAEEAEFVLLDSEQQEVYATTFDLSGEPGVVKLSLPQKNEGTNEPVIAAGEEYTWFLALVCNRDDRSYDEIVEGVVQRQEINQQLQAQISSSSGLETAQIYAQAGIWTDALMILAQLRKSQPQQWENFLQSVDLGDYATEPFVDCCIAEEY